MTTAIRSGPVVPAYFHPATAPAGWRALARAARSVRLVVVNAASGPGHERDPAYGFAVDRLLDAGTPIAGYIDTDYGRRPASDALADVIRYRAWYGVSSVFFDRVSSGVERIPYYRSLAGDARDAGARLVAFNHGTYPARDYTEHADLLGTFEGPVRAYADVDVPSWVHDLPATRFFHLIYDCPPCYAETVARLAAQRNVGSLYRTHRTGPNPWDTLPGDFPGVRPDGFVGHATQALLAGDTGPSGRTGPACRFAPPGTREG